MEFVVREAVGVPGGVGEQGVLRLARLAPRFAQDDRVVPCSAQDDRLLPRLAQDDREERAAGAGQFGHDARRRAGRVLRFRRNFGGEASCALFGPAAG